MNGLYTQRFNRRHARLARHREPLGASRDGLRHWGNLTSVTVWPDPGTALTTTTAYDATYHVFPISVTNPAGEAVGTPTSPLVYDQAGRLTSIPGIVTEVLYDAAGRPTRQSNGNGTLTERGYSPRGFLTGIRTESAGQIPPVLIQDLTYTPDAASLLGEVTSPSPTRAGATPTTTCIG